MVMRMMNLHYIIIVIIIRAQNRWGVSVIVTIVIRVRHGSGVKWKIDRKT